MPEDATSPIKFESRKITPLRFLWSQHKPLVLFDELAVHPSDIDYVKIGQRSIVLVKHPDLVQQFLVADSSRVIKGRTRERARFFRFLGEGLLNTEGEAQRRQRRLILPAFHRSRLAGYAKAMVDSSLEVISEWKDSEIRDVGKDMMRLTLAIVSRTLFSSDVNKTSAVIATAFNQLTLSINRFMIPGATWLLRLPLPFARRIDAAQTELDAVVYALIQERRAGGVDTGDLLSMLLLAQDAEQPGDRLSDREVRDQTMTLLFAGHETTSNALTWTLWLLATHPEVEAKLHEELLLVLGGREPNGEDYPRLIYTERIIREVLRLYPPVWTIGRRTVGDITLGDLAVASHSLVLASQWLIHRSSRWYPDPLAFNPDRWTTTFRTSLPRFAYFPFGGGARSCIGENFAWMEFVLVIATITQHWHFSVKDETQTVLPLARITLHPDRPVRLKIHKRN